MNHIEINNNYESSISKIYESYKINNFYKKKFQPIYKNIIIIFFIVYINYLWITLVIELSPLIYLISRDSYKKFTNNYIDCLYTNQNFKISTTNFKIN